jgi:hypothetical protein
MANVMDGIAFDSYCIHYDAKRDPAFISRSVNNAVSIGTSGRDLRTLEPNRATASGS